MNDAGKPDGKGVGQSSHAGGKTAAATIPKGTGEAGASGGEQKKATAAAGPGGGGKTAASQTPGGAQPDQSASTPPKTQLEAIPLAVDIGWSMAVLFGERQRPTLETPGPPDRLPTEHELSSTGRIGLESGRLKALLTRLKSLLEASSGASIEFPPIDLTNGPKPSGESGQIILETADLVTLQTANLGILKWLACAGREYGVAYQLGRSLRDTANPPPHPGAAADQGQPEIKTRVAEIIASPQWQVEQDKKRLPAEARPAEAEKQAKAEAARQALRHQLARPRVSTLQGWLATLAPYLPANTAAIVSVSIGRWCDLVSTIFDPATPGNLRRLQAPSKLNARSYRAPSKLNARSYRAPSKLNARSYQAPSQLEVAPELIGSLLPQGDAWINLLVGTESTQVLLTPEGLVAAGEAALSRTARIVKRIVVHYWFALLILAAALAGTLYVSATYLVGAAKVWTQIAAVAGALGVTAKGIGSTMARLCADAEKPIFTLEETDAMAWAVTTIPANLKVTIRGVHALRRNGIPPTGPMGRS